MELDKFGVESSNTEMLALISYLRHIPASKRKKDLDSLEHLKFNKKKEAWDEINLDSSNVVLKIANNKDNAINGKLIFEQKCAACHGTQGGGMIGPNLTDDYWLHGGTKKEIAKTIAHGVTSKGMISWKHTLTPKQIGEVISFITSIKGINPPNAKDPQGIKK